MKRSTIVLLLIMSLGLVRCIFSSDTIYYSFENGEGEFKFESTDQDTTKSISFWTMEFQENKDPFSINFIYSEAVPNVEKLQSFESSLYYFDLNNNRVDVTPESDLKIEYNNEKAIVTKNIKNNTSDLNTLIDWKDVNYSYEFLGKQYAKQDNYVTYTLSYDFPLKDYPDSLYFKIKLQWENGSREYESKMIKRDYVAPKINPKF